MGAAFTMIEDPFVPYDVPGVGTVTAHEGGFYIVAMLDGRVCGFPAPLGNTSEANAAADIAAEIASPTPPPPPADDRPIGTRVGLNGEFAHSQVSTIAGVTLLGVMPWGWAPVDFQAWIDEAFDSGRTLSVGTAGSAARYVSGLAVSTIGFKQATPLQLVPLSAQGGTPIFLKKSAATATGNIIKASLIIERKYIP
jgi:hypothetical protein